MFWWALGATVALAVVVLWLVVTDIIDSKMAARQRAISQQRAASDTAVVRSIQNTVAAMFDAVRQQR